MAQLNVEKSATGLNLPKPLKKRLKRILDLHELKPSAAQWLTPIIEKAVVLEEKRLGLSPVK